MALGFDAPWDEVTAWIITGRKYKVYEYVLRLVGGGTPFDITMCFCGIAPKRMETFGMRDSSMHNRRKSRVDFPDQRTIDAAVVTLPR